jgi:hypothetical protein
MWGDFPHTALRFRLRCAEERFLTFAFGAADFLRTQLCFRASIKSMTLLSSPLPPALRLSCLQPCV